MDTAYCGHVARDPGTSLLFILRSFYSSSIDRALVQPRCRRYGLVVGSALRDMMPAIEKNHSTVKLANELCAVFVSLLNLSNSSVSVISDSCVTVDFPAPYRFIDD